MLLLVLLAVPGRALADEPPLIDHQQVACTVPDKPLSLCATVTDDRQVAKARVFFREAGKKYYSFVDMTFGGINYCGTLPALRAGKLKALEYYVQAVDDQYQSQRTSTFQMQVQPESVCEFPPLEKDPARAASIRVHATDKKQGNKMTDAFHATGVSFVPLTQR